MTSQTRVASTCYVLSTCQVSSSCEVCKYVFFFVDNLSAEEEEEAGEEKNQKTTRLKFLSEQKLGVRVNFRFNQVSS